MRTILFRGKRLDNGKWVVGSLVTDNVLRAWIDIEDGMVEIDMNTVGQFTGIVDKNGNEIYEGDIIRSDCHGEVRHLISFFDIIASFVAEMLPDNGINDYCTLSQAWILKYNKEAIGNIYDNPELLK